MVSKIICIFLSLVLIGCVTNPNVSENNSNIPLLTYVEQGVNSYYAFFDLNGLNNGDTFTLTVRESNGNDGFVVVDDMLFKYQDGKQLRIIYEDSGVVVVYGNESAECELNRDLKSVEGKVVYNDPLNIDDMDRCIVFGYNNIKSAASSIIPDNNYDSFVGDYGVSISIKVN